MGPTSAGKSALALEVAAERDVDVAALDPFYALRELNVGTGKSDLLAIDARETHLIDLVEANEAPPPNEQLLAQLREVVETRSRPVIIDGCSSTLVCAAGAVLPSQCLRVGLWCSDYLSVLRRTQRRVQGMFAQGAIEEVKQLIERGDGGAFALRHSIIYRWALAVLWHHVPEQRAVDLCALELARDHFHQLEAYRSLPDVAWFDTAREGQRVAHNRVLQYLDTAGPRAPLKSTDSADPTDSQLTRTRVSQPGGTPSTTERAPERR